jgi:hypothetical protein
VYENSVTRALLRSWADGGELQLAAFFCWYSGSAEQRSNSGLLRSLLYEVLRQHRELIRTVFADEWAEQRSLSHALVHSGSFKMGLVWHVKRLERAFIQLAELANDRLKLCFFVDGLDECDGDGQHEDHDSIAQLFKNISTSPYVKVCLSSRPWLVFEQMFKSLPGLRLQDLTRDDIRVFVFDKLNSSEKMRQLVTTEPKLSEEFVTEITTKSDGVFLWVDLVVKSLLKGLQNDDDLPQLLHRLRELPSTLERLFQHMLDRIDPTYMPEACRILLIYQSSSRYTPQVTPIDIDIAATATYQEALLTDITPMQLQEIDFRYNRISTRLKTHCLGLLEVHYNLDNEWKAHEDDSMYHDISDHHGMQEDRQSTDANRQPDRIGLRTDSRVTYLHRTVADFLRLPLVKERLHAEAQKQTGFQSDLSVLMGYLISIQRSACTHYAEATYTERVWSIVRDALCCAAHIPLSFDLRRTAILGDLSNSAFRWMMGRINASGPEGHRLNTGTTLKWESEFLARATVLGLTSYIKNRIDSIGELIAGPSQIPLLLYAVGNPNAELEGLISDWFIAADQWVTSPETVTVLLERGTNPNERCFWLSEKIEGHTIWEMALHRLHTQIRTTDPQQAEVLHAWARVIKAFLEHNADLKATRWIYDRSKKLSEECSISSIIDTVFNYAVPADAAMLRRVLEQRRTGQRPPQPLLFRHGEKRKFESDSQDPQKRMKA